MLGDAPPAFDLLYWNGDGTNLPAKMVVEYLRGLCQQNRFAEEGYTICGEKVSIEGVKVPLCAVACETDHIAAWKSSFRGVAQDGIEGQDLHPVGIRPYRRDREPAHQEEVRPLHQRRHAGGRRYLAGGRHPSRGFLVAALGGVAARRSGKQIPARTLPEEVFAPAPGTYVTADPNAADD
jgi:polyhydroxyalkanoate synthase subunit PhaC